MKISAAQLDEVVAKYSLVQAASNPARPAFHVPCPAGARRGVLTDTRVVHGEARGYVWLTSLPNNGAQFLGERPDVHPVGTGGACVRIVDLSYRELDELVGRIVDHLS